MSFLETAERAVGVLGGAAGANAADEVASARMAMGSFMVGLCLMDGEEFMPLLCVVLMREVTVHVRPTRG